MSDTEHRHRAVTALMRHLFSMDLSGVSLDGFAPAFLDQLTAVLGVDRVALVVDGCVRTVGLPADALALADDASLAWARDAHAGIELALGDASVEIAETVLGLFVSVIERRRAEQRLLHDAFHDPLTGLPNRTLFVDHLEHALGRARRSTGQMFSVLFIDIDRFKLVNDSLGHDAGDQLLIGFAQRLRRIVRSGDVVARIGGDEFAVLADDLAEVNDAIQMANRINSGLRAPFEFGGHRVVVSASMGVARNAPRYEQGNELLRDADIAMCRAKQHGGGTHRMFDAEMHTAMVSRMRLETDLRVAVDENQLRLAYQPIVRIADGEVAGFEALLRWRHPTRGPLLPGDFIAAAEETGMIVSIGRWTLGEVCRRLALVNRGRTQPVSISVNLSDREILQPGLVDEIARALRESGAAPDTLHLELTERMVFTSGRVERELLPRLKAIGVRLMIDDFGTGYSSLSRLQRLPIDTLKIDHSFVNDLGSNRESDEIVRTIIRLAHELGIGVVAEGVERDAQLRLLRDAGCDFAQGYLFSKPVDERRVSPMLARAAWLPA